MFSAYTYIHVEENLSAWHVALVLRCSLHTHTFIWKKISVSDTWRYCSDVLCIHIHSSGRKSQCLTRGVSAQMFSAYTYIHLEENLSVWHVALVLRCSLHTHTFIWKKISVSDRWRYCSDVLCVHIHPSGRKSQCLTRGVSAQMFSVYTYIHLEENLSAWHLALVLRCSLRTHTSIWKKISVSDTWR